MKKKQAEITAANRITSYNVCYTKLLRCTKLFLDKTRTRRHYHVTTDGRDNDNVYVLRGNSCLRQSLFST